MIFESEDEKNAFDFVCYLADEETSRHGCNDLEPEQLKVFSNILVDAQDVNCTKFQKFVTMDFEIIYWLKKQVKEEKRQMRKQEQDLFVVKGVMPVEKEMKVGKEYIEINPEKREEIIDELTILLSKKDLTKEQDAKLHVLCLVMFNQTPKQVKKLCKFIRKRIPKDTDDEEKEIENIINKRIVKIERVK